MKRDLTESRYNMKELPSRIDVTCANAGDCHWPGLEDASLVIAKQQAEQHIRHTGHGVLITQRTWYVEDDD